MALALGNLHPLLSVHIAVFAHVQNSYLQFVDGYFSNHVLLHAEWQTPLQFGIVFYSGQFIVRTLYFHPSLRLFFYSGRTEINIEGLVCLV